MTVLLRYIATAFIAVSMTAYGSQAGNVSCTVVDERGSPVAGARVMLMIMDNRIQMLVVPTRLTGDDGRFLFDEVRAGTYLICASKVAEGYPESCSPLYSATPQLRITLTAAAPSADVSIQLGPKAGAATGYVADASNGLVMSSTYSLGLVSDPNQMVGARRSGADGKFHLLVPVYRAVTLEVYAEGYERFRSEPIQLGSGVEMPFNIRLTKKKEAAAEPDDKKHESKHPASGKPTILWRFGQ